MCTHTCAKKHCCSFLLISKVIIAIFFLSENGALCNGHPDLGLKKKKNTTLNGKLYSDWSCSFDGPRSKSLLMIFTVQMFSESEK